MLLKPRSGQFSHELTSLSKALKTMLLLFWLTSCPFFAASTPLPPQLLSLFFLAAFFSFLILLAVFSDVSCS